MKFITPYAHSIIGLVVGIALILAPKIFGFTDNGGAAVWVPTILGIIIILTEIFLRGSFSGVGFVPVSLHVGVDVLMGLFLLVSPWLFSFSDTEKNAWLPHVIMGVVIVGYALATKTENEENA